MKSLLSCLIISLAISAFSAAQDNGVLFLVRHAERDAAGGDAALLNQTGERRAQCLARTLELSGITQIYATEVKRTQQTAAPLAEELHLQPIIVPRADVAKLVADLKNARNAKALVVAHADTLPAIVTQLEAGSLPTSKPGEQDYDRLIIVPTRDGKPLSLTVIRYCPVVEETSR